MAVKLEMEASVETVTILMLSKSNSKSELHDAGGIIDDDIRKFVGQPWRNWATALGRWSPSSAEEPPKLCESDCTTLSFEDKQWAGEMPGTEPFIAHVCKLCKAAVKPGFLTQHYALWHDVKPEEPLPPFEELEKDPLNTTLRTHRISPCCKLILGAPKVKIKKQKQVKSINNTRNSAFASTTAIPPSTRDVSSAVIPTGLSNKGASKGFSNPLEGCQETIPNISVSLPLKLSVPIKPLVTSSHVTTAAKTSKLNIKNTKLGVLLPVVPSARGSSATDKPVRNVVPVVTHSKPLASPPPKKRSKSDRKYLPVKDREYNPDKHCGVWNLETKKHCTRSLTCNCHSLSQRRAVTGRSKTFDKLLADHRAAKETSQLATKSSVVHVHRQDKRRKSVASLAKTSTVHQQELPKPHKFCIITSFPSISALLNHHKRQAVPSSVRLPSYPAKLLNFEVIKSGIKPLAPTFTKKVTIAKFPPCHSGSTQPAGVNNILLKTKIDRRISSGTSWGKQHPKPLAVCSFAAHKSGSLLSHTTQMAITRKILRTSLIHGFIKVPLPRHRRAAAVQTNHTAVNIPTKGNPLGGSNVVLITSITSKPSKLLHSRNSSNNKIVHQSLALATVVPKTTSVKAGSSSESVAKNVQQFHVSTVLTPCSNQNEILQHKKKNQVSRMKQKNSIDSSNEVEIIGTVLPQKTNGKSRGSHVPVVPLAVANSVNSTSSANLKMEEDDVVFISQSTVVSDRFFSNIPGRLSSKKTVLQDGKSVSTKLKGNMEWRHKT